MLPGYGNPIPIPVPVCTHDWKHTVLPIPMPCLNDKQWNTQNKIDTNDLQCSSKRATVDNYGLEEESLLAKAEDHSEDGSGQTGANRPYNE